MAAYFDRSSITLPEVIAWWAFFSLFLFSLVLEWGAVQNILLMLGTAIGVVCLYVMVKLAKDIDQNKAEMRIWGYRFLVFKAVPVVLSLLFGNWWAIII